MYVYKLRPWKNCYLICNIEHVTTDINSFKFIDSWGNNGKINIEMWIAEDIVVDYNFNSALPRLSIINPHNINNKKKLISEDIIEVVFNIINIKNNEVLSSLNSDKFLFVLNLLQICLYK